MATNASESAIKPNATIATKIGLIVPIKETTIKNFVTRMGMLDEKDIVPKQVPKSTIVTVSAIVEKLLTFVVGKTTDGIEGTSFNLEHVITPINASVTNNDSNLTILAPFVSLVKSQMETSKAEKKSKSKKDKSKNDQENITIDDAEDEDVAIDVEPHADDMDIPADDEPGKKKAKELPTLAKCSFSCSNQIAKQVKTLKENIRVSSEAVEMIQYFLDEFYQKMVRGAYWIAQNNGRRTISKNDIVVSLKIMVPESFASEVLEHVETLSAKFKEVEATKNKEPNSGEGKADKPARKAKTAKKATGKSPGLLSDSEDDTQAVKTNKKEGPSVITKSTVTKKKANAKSAV